MPFEARSWRGLDVVAIDVAGARALVSMQGAQVLSWLPAGSAHDVLWCSSIVPAKPGGAIRGGIPVCWPWFGPHPVEAKRPQHGFARNTVWRLLDVLDTSERTVLMFALSAADCAAFAPEHRLDALLTITVGPRTLGLMLETSNGGTSAAPLSLALHSYFTVSDVAAVAIEGIDGARFRDNARGGVWTAQHGPLRISGETVALFDEAPDRQIILDPGLARRIAIRRRGAGSTIVWNPGASAARIADIGQGEVERFVCVESGCIGTNAVMLGAGETHALDVEIAVAPL